MCDSGIHSLAGFMYQIDVFIQYAFKMTIGQKIIFEGSDDVQIDNIDEDTLFNIVGIPNAMIQVKKSTYSSSIHKILANWIELYNPNYSYIVVTKNAPSKTKIFSDTIIKNFIKKLKKNSESKDIYSRIYKAYKVDEDEIGILDIINEINENSEAIRISNIEKTNINLCGIHTSDFAKDNDNMDIYNDLAELRYKAIKDKLERQILEKIRNEERFEIKHSEFRATCNLISREVGMDNIINIVATKLEYQEQVLCKLKSDDREVIQLKSADQNSEKIIKELQYMFNYERNKDNIEKLYYSPVYDEFEIVAKDLHDDAVGYLKAINNDNPSIRFFETMKKDVKELNHAMNRGIFTHLTKETILKELKVTYCEDSDE